MRRAEFFLGSNALLGVSVFVTYWTVPVEVMVYYE